MSSKKEIVNVLLLKVEELWSLDDSLEIIKTYKKVLEIDPKNYEALIDLSHCLLEL